MTTQQTFPKITDEAIAALRGRIGIEHPWTQPYYEWAHPDNIRHFCDGIGDMNPLYRSEEYAAKTGWKTVIAPPAFLYCCWYGGGYDDPSKKRKLTEEEKRRGRGGALPGIHGLWSGCKWEWYVPVRLGDRLTPTEYLADVQEKRGRFAGRQLLETQEKVFRNGKGVVVAKCQDYSMRIERDKGHETKKYGAVTAPTYTAEEIARIEEEVLSEEIRGANPRYWEDVQIGESLKPVVKGPLLITDMVCWYAGRGGRFNLANEIRTKYFQRHPAAGVTNEHGVRDVPNRVHWDNEFAKRIGAPGAYDVGPQRVSWVTHLLTNWIGDDGFLKSLQIEARAMNHIMDITRCKGVVKDKYVKDGHHVVAVEVWAENQRGITMPGRAEVVLSTKAEPVNPYQRL